MCCAGRSCGSIRGTERRYEPRFAPKGVRSVNPESQPPAGDADAAREQGAPRPENEPEASAHAASEGSPPSSGGAGPQAIPLGALPTADVLVWNLSLLAGKAWEGMGLVPNPLTNKVEKNLDEARLAIDAFAAIFEVLRLRIEEPTRREMETVLTNLRINFVEKSSG
ncbi:MAG: DUF1844 domain-containing protein [Bacillati bacterium ANGP1]|uniref:DUF1844 domain-containing protein n=1 Tax=Candidatus Segetimicrobium genomatis TaxID=2569760 RepID=A0A537K0U3_9BACT|nr:MAG: DUF1844 domain-containing protein [Terrabacteria group bacterium ANGP1]